MYVLSVTTIHFHICMYLYIWYIDLRSTFPQSFIVMLTFLFSAGLWVVNTDWYSSVAAGGQWNWSCIHICHQKASANDHVRDRKSPHSDLPQLTRLTPTLWPFHWPEDERHWFRGNWSYLPGDWGRWLCWGHQGNVVLLLRVWDQSGSSVSVSDSLCRMWPNRLRPSPPPLLHPCPLSPCRFRPATPHGSSPRLQPMELCWRHQLVWFFQQALPSCQVFGHVPPTPPHPVSVVFFLFTLTSRRPGPAPFRYITATWHTHHPSQPASGAASDHYAAVCVYTAHHTAPPSRHRVTGRSACCPIHHTWITFVFSKE